MGGGGVGWGSGKNTTLSYVGFTYLGGRGGGGRGEGG